MRRPPASVHTSDNAKIAPSVQRVDDRTATGAITRDAVRQDRQAAHPKPGCEQGVIGGLVDDHRSFPTRHGQRDSESGSRAKLVEKAILRGVGSTALRGHLARWSFLAGARVIVSNGWDVRRNALVVSSMAALWGAAYIWWLGSGNGPWRPLGLNTAPVTPRGLPAGRFWR